MLTDRMFVSAEESTSPFYGVWVMLTTWSVRLDTGEVVPAAFVVTTSTGYRAELRACMFDGHPMGYVNCVRKIDDRHSHAGMSIDKWCEHIQTHCHGYHLPLAQDFRDRVQSTYERRIAA